MANEIIDAYRRRHEDLDRELRLVVADAVKVAMSAKDASALHMGMSMVRLLAERLLDDAGIINEMGYRAVGVRPVKREKINEAD